MSVVIIGSGDGRAALRRFDAAQNDSAYAIGTRFTATEAGAINLAISNLCRLADLYGCPEDPCPE